MFMCPLICQLLKSVWYEAQGKLSSLLSHSISTLTLTLGRGSPYIGYAFYI